MNLTPAEIKEIKELLKTEIDIFYDDNHDDIPNRLKSLAKKFNL